MFGNLLKKRTAKAEKFLKEQPLGAPLVVQADPISLYAEQFRTLRTNIDFSQVDQNLKSLMVTSAIPAEGKTLISSNLAVIQASTEKSVLLVDADFRKPTLHRTFRISNEKGLTSLLVAQDPEAGLEIRCDQETGVYLLPSGPIPPNPAELLSSARMNMVMKMLSKQFDLVIYDVPPVNSVTDAQIMAGKVDGAILVVRSGYVRKEEVKAATEALKNVDANVLGYVLNDVDRKEKGGYYSYSYYRHEE